MSAGTSSSGQNPTLSIHILIVLIASLAIAATAALVDPPRASALTISPLCEQANSPAWDGNYGRGFPGSGSVLAGETFLVKASNPAVPGTTLSLQIDSAGLTAVSTTRAPGLLKYVVPKTLESATIHWRTDSGVADFTVLCLPAGTQAVDSDLDGACNRGVTSDLCTGSDTCSRTPLLETVDENGCTQAQVDSNLDGVCNRGVRSNLWCPTPPP